MRILLVDDHALVLEGLKTFLTANDIEVVGTATNGAEAIIKFEMLQPELVLMDIQMADCDGIQTTKMIKKEYPEAKIVMLTAVGDDESLFAAMQAGAQGYLLKDMEPKSFIRQLKRATVGEMSFSPGLTERLLRELCRFKQEKKTINSKKQLKLTERQTALLQFLAEGLTYKEIADRLGITVATVRYHIKEMINKTKLTNRAQLIAHALQFGLSENETER